MLIDTHCHLYFDAYDHDRDEVIKRARDFGVNYMVNVGTDPQTNDACFELSQEHDFIFHTAGLHPHHSHEVLEEELEAFGQYVEQKKPVAIGEIGLDYFKSQSDRETQKKVFVRMLHLAMDNNLPVIVHSREAFGDTLDIIKAETNGRLKGVMHCFSYDKESLGKLLDIGFLASFTCNITFKNAASLLDVACFAPLERIMLETDSPYLAPQIYRGKRNEPSCLVHLADFLSEKRQIPRHEIDDITSATAIKFFNLNIPNA